jgi:folate-dependent phosphoribosylglycinamide formyltransferase PurN
VVLAPVDNGPFSQVVCRRCLEEPGVELAGIVVRTIVNPARLRSELRRDGIWLLRKIWKKLVLGSDDAATRGENGFFELAVREGARGEGLSRLARRHGIPLTRVADHNDSASVALLERAAPDAVAFTGGGILRKPLLDVAGQGVFNTHMGPLPEYRGMDVIEWPLLEVRDKPRIGVSLHFMAAGIDTGPIVRVEPVPIHPGDTMERLRKRFEPVMADLLMDGIRSVRDGTLSLRSQEPNEGRQYFVMHPRFYAVSRRELARHAGIAEDGGAAGEEATAQGSGER